MHVLYPNTPLIPLLLSHSLSGVHGQKNFMSCHVLIVCTMNHIPSYPHFSCIYILLHSHIPLILHTPEPLCVISRVHTSAPIHSSSSLVLFQKHHVLAFLLLRAHTATVYPTGLHHTHNPLSPLLFQLFPIPEHNYLHNTTHITPHQITPYQTALHATTTDIKLTRRYQSLL